MPKIDISEVPVYSGSIYPAEFQESVAGRERQRIGDAGGLTQFGVNVTRLPPGVASSLRHWHEVEDEMIFMLLGEVVLVEDGGETPLRAGDAAAWKANSGNGHQLINRAERDALFLEIGTRSEKERTVYVDVDLVQERDANGRRMLHKSGEPY
jgi:uncharacterized cupin superfamily protein